jgi:hypothetical protein
MPEEQMVVLIAPRGTDEANFNETRFKVRDDGTITVPMSVAVDLMHGAGFAMAPVQPVTLQPIQPDAAAADEVSAALDADPEI